MALIAARLLELRNECESLRDACLRDAEEEPTLNGDGAQFYNDLSAALEELLMRRSFPGASINNEGVLEVSVMRHGEHSSR